MDVNLLSKSFKVRRLNKRDIDMIYDLSCENKIFYQYHPPFVTKESIEEDFEALPPNKSYQDKYYLGFFDGDILIAIIDLILSYPTKEIAFIGLFMTNIEYQNKGIGSNIIRDVCSYLKEIGYKRVRLGVDKGNPQSYHLWIKNNFETILENDYILMEIEL